MKKRSQLGGLEGGVKYTKNERGCDEYSILVGNNVAPYHPVTGQYYDKEPHHGGSSTVKLGMDWKGLGNKLMTDNTSGKRKSTKEMIFGVQVCASRELSLSHGRTTVDEG